jgi:hypothetical protein
MAFDLREIDYVLEKVRSELGTLLHIEKHCTSIGGFVVATESLSAIKEVPDNQLALHPADLKGMHHFKTRERAEEIARFWNDNLAKKGLEYEHLRVTVMTKKEHLLALIPHHRPLIETFEKVRQALIEKESSEAESY